MRESSGNSHLVEMMPVFRCESRVRMMSSTKASAASESDGAMSK